jgi:hypothetical protein
MTRRNAGRGRRQAAGGPSAAARFGQVLGLSSGRPVFTAARYTVDGGSGKVAAFVDWNNGAHTLSQATSANQVAIPTGHANFAGKSCAVFSLAALTVYSSNIAGCVDFMHDGTGGESFLVFTATGGTGVPTGSRDTGARGFTLARFADGHVDSYVVNAASGLVVSNSSAAAAVPNDVATYINVSLATASTPDSALRVKGSTLVSADALLPPEAGASAAPLRLGGDMSPGNYMDMRWAALLFFPALTAGQRAIVQQWIQAEYGIAP